MPAHPIAHLELSAQDPAAASRFYADVFGWKINHNVKFDYNIFEGESEQRGGFVKPNGMERRAGDVVVYIGADDIDATLEKVLAQGGTILQAKTEIPGVAWYALFADPAGNRLGLYKRMA